MPRGECHRECHREMAIGGVPRVECHRGSSHGESATGGECMRRVPQGAPLLHAREEPRRHCATNSSFTFKIPSELSGTARTHARTLEFARLHVQKVYSPVLVFVYICVRTQMGKGIHTYVNMQMNILKCMQISRRQNGYSLLLKLGHVSDISLL